MIQLNLNNYVIDFVFALVGTQMYKKNYCLLLVLLLKDSFFTANFLLLQPSCYDVKYKFSSNIPPLISSTSTLLPYYLILLLIYLFHLLFITLFLSIPSPPFFFPIHYIQYILLVAFIARGLTFFALKACLWFVPNRCRVFQSPRSEEVEG